jgi:molybdate transport system regulatory protein
MRMDFASGLTLGPSRTAILEGIDRLGSIAACARALGMSYQGVWSTVQTLNREFPRPLVSIRTGGRSSGASLTPFGKRVAEGFRAMERDVNLTAKRHFRFFERQLGENPSTPAPIPDWARLREPEPEPAIKKSKPKNSTARRGIRG